MTTLQLVANKEELIESCQRFVVLRSSLSPAERTFFDGRIKNIKRFVAIPQPDGTYSFAPGAYVAYHGASSLEEWESLATKAYRQNGRKHLEKLLSKGMVDESHPLYETLKQAFEVFCGNVEPSSGDVTPLRFWLINTDGNETKPIGGEEWTDQELFAAVSTYLQMLALEQLNKPYVKKDFNEALRRNDLSNRSHASVEYRMQNISAVLEELCLPRIEGYRPAKNIGEKAKQKIKAILESQSYVVIELYEPVEDSGELDRKVASLRKRIVSGQPKGNQAPKRTSSVRESFVRDPLVKAYVLEIADGICESCDSQAPFVMSCGSPYLEVHHIKTLAEGGTDQVSNAAALCPNCHRSLHLAANREEKKSHLYQKLKRLIPE